MENFINENSKFVASTRISKSGIYTNFKSVSECVYNLIGIQAQYSQFAMLSIYNRTTNCTLSKIGDLGKNFKLIYSWGQRVTLHMYVIEDWKFINNIYGQRVNWIKNNIDNYEIKLVDILEKIDVLGKSKKYLSKIEIMNVINHYNSKELMKWGGILVEACLNNLLIGVVLEKNKKLYVHKSWINNYEYKNLDNNILILLKRYYQNYGPASINDFKHWSGLNKKDFISDFELLKKDLVSLKVDDEILYMFKEDYKKYSNQNYVNSKIVMLGKFDPLMVSYSNKEWIVDKDHIKTIWGKGGQIAAVIIINNRVVGLWKYKLIKETMTFYITTFKKLSKTSKKQINIQCKKISKFYNKEIDKVIYEGE